MTFAVVLDSVIVLPNNMLLLLIQILFQLSGHTSYVTRVAYSIQKEFLISADGVGNIRVWKSNEGDS